MNDYTIHMKSKAMINVGKEVIEKISASLETNWHVYKDTDSEIFIIIQISEIEFITKYNV